MDIGISLPSVRPGADREFLVEVAVLADQLGFHSVWASDHVILPKHRKSVYPYPESTTEVAFSPGVAWLDPVAVMGVVAGATKRVGIGTNVLVLPYRSPIVLAAELASLDLLSEGRIILGVGVGWMDEEFAALGVPKSERGARTDEYIEVMRLLWGAQDPVSFKGRFVRFEEMELAAKPHRTGGPLICIGGNTAPALRRAGRLGDGWLGFEVFLEDVSESVDLIEKTARDAGRDPASLMLSVRRGLLPPFDVSNFLPERRSITGSASEVADEIKRYREFGISLLVFDLVMLEPEITRTIQWFAGEVAPLLQ